MVIFDRNWHNRAGVEPVMGPIAAEITARLASAVFALPGTLESPTG